DHLVPSWLIDDIFCLTGSISHGRRLGRISRSSRESNDGGSFDVEERDRLLRDQSQHVVEVERGGDGVRDALHGAQLSDLALQSRIGPAIEARVLDANGE